jgi:hypothetical protein
MNLIYHHSFKENYYYDTMIDRLINNMDQIISTNVDYKKIIDTIDSINSIYLDIFNEILNKNRTDIYGLTSLNILDNISKVNNISGFYNDRTVNFSLEKINNIDFLKYNHTAFNLISSEQSTLDQTKLTFGENSTPNKILTPLFEQYIASNKISTNLINYLTNINEFNINQTNYIKNNIDYINNTNPNNYKEKYLSPQEIQQDINDKFYDYSGDTTINLLHPNIR